MPDAAAHAGLRLTASRGVPPHGAAEPRPPHWGCQRAVHDALQTAWTAISRAGFDMNGLVAHSRLPLSRAWTELQRVEVLTIRELTPGLPGPAPADSLQQRKLEQGVSALSEGQSEQHERNGFQQDMQLLVLLMHLLMGSPAGADCPHAHLCHKYHRQAQVPVSRPTAGAAQPEHLTLSQHQQAGTGACEPDHRLSSC